MRLEEQVCSFESARRLKELGIKQESLFWWHEHKWRNKYHEHRDDVSLKYGSDRDHYPEEYWDMYSAFTAAELGEMLPKSIAHSVTYGLEYCTRLNDEPYGVFYKACSGRYGNLCWITGTTEAEARAKMLIYLIEKKLCP